MTLSEEQIKLITELAKLRTFTVLQVAISAGIEVDFFREQLLIPDSPIAQTYNAGRLTGDFEFENAVQKLSANGSGPAQSLMHKLSQNRRVLDVIDFYNAH